MAKLYVTEYSSFGFYTFPLQVGGEPFANEYTVAISSVSAQSTTPFGPSTVAIRIVSDVICSIVISSNPTATTNNKRISADEPEYFGVRVGHLIAVVSNT